MWVQTGLGFKTPPGAGSTRRASVIEAPQDMHMLLDESFLGRGALRRNVGLAGDDDAARRRHGQRFLMRFAKALGPIVQIRLAGHGDPQDKSAGVTISYMHSMDAPKKLDATYCVVAHALLRC